jgi:GAF domain-containing protein
MFPIFSTVAEILLQGSPLTWRNCLEIQSQSPLLWVIDTAPFFLGFFARMAGQRQDRLLKQVDALDQALAELTDLRTRQEEEIENRTHDLTRRSLQLETAARIARDAATIHSMQELLDSTVSLISDHFGFYHTGIFLLDEEKAFAELHAASSKGGQQMLARAHRLRVGETSIVGFAVQHNEARIALDVGVDAIYFDNPDLPATRSEIAIPLRNRGEVIGALDVQSLEPVAFRDDDVVVLQALADQVAVAIDNARLFREAEKSLKAERQAYGQLGRDSWRQLLGLQPDMVHRYDPKGVLVGVEKWRPQARTAAERKEKVLDKYKESATLSVPIVIHDQVIGVIDAHKPSGAGEWTSEEIALMETYTEQMNLALDSARLHQESQRRVAREQAIGEVARQLRGSLDIDTVLQTAVREIGEIMNLAEVQVRIAGDRRDAR